MNDVELGQGGPEARRRATALARSLCTDAPLYGGHPCLSCQASARQLVARAGQEDVPPALRPGGIQAPPHGTSHKTSRSQWARVLSAFGAQSPPAAFATGDGAGG